VRSRQAIATIVAAAFLHFFANDVIAQIDAFIADEYGGTGDQLTHFVLAFATERAVQQFACVAAVLGVISHGT
jgi:hypothetical protein